MAVAGAVVVVGVLKTLGLLDEDSAGQAVTLLIGLIAGAGAGVAGSRPKG